MWTMLSTNLQQAGAKSPHGLNLVLIHCTKHLWNLPPPPPPPPPAQGNVLERTLQNLWMLKHIRNVSVTFFWTQRFVTNQGKQRYV